MTRLPGLGAEAFRQKLAGLEISSNGFVPVSQMEGVLQQVAPGLSRHQAIGILRQLPRNTAQQVFAEALIGALGV